MLRVRDDQEARFRHRAGNGEQELEVPVRVGPHGDDVEIGAAFDWAESVNVDAERDECDGHVRPPVAKPDFQAFVLAVGDDGGCAASAPA